MIGLRRLERRIDSRRIARLSKPGIVERRRVAVADFAHAASSGDEGRHMIAETDHRRPPVVVIVAATVATIITVAIFAMTVVAIAIIAAEIFPAAALVSAMFSGAVATQAVPLDVNPLVFGIAIIAILPQFGVHGRLDRAFGRFDAGAALRRF
ncbi:MAG TPA: hypothetical protein PKZ99_10640, partial [Azospirillaceae bacterium]|nr:hypothetical protein [Azospirillaceae bacterium]